MNGATQFFKSSSLFATSMVTVILSALAILVSCSTTGGGGGDVDYDLPSFKEVRLKNGLPVLLIQDKKLPTFSLNLMIRSGSATEPKGQSGVAEMVGELLNKGSNERSAQELAESIESIGGSFGVSVSDDYTMVTASSLSMVQNQLIKDFAEIVTQPAFAEAEVQRVQKRMVASIRQVSDNPQSFAGAAFSRYLYGAHPYALAGVSSLSDVQRLRRKNIIRYYLGHYRPNNAILAVVGKFESDIIDRLNKTLSDWSPREIEKMSFPEIPKIQGREIQLVDKAGLQQTQIRIGHLGIKRDNKDFLTLRVATEILGGGFLSRLVDEVRKKKGLTYSIGSTFDARKDEGPFLIYTFTRHEKVGETIETTLKVFEEYVKNGVNEEELNRAKSVLKGVFPRSLETPESLAFNLLVLRYYGISDSYLTDFINNVDDISIEGVNQAIKTYFHPDKLKILVYSTKAKVIRQLRPLGVVKTKPFNQVL